MAKHIFLERQRRSSHHDHHRHNNDSSYFITDINADDGSNFSTTTTTATVSTASSTFLDNTTTARSYGNKDAVTADTNNKIDTETVVAATCNAHHNSQPTSPSLSLSSPPPLTDLLNSLRTSNNNKQTPEEEFSSKRKAYNYGHGHGHGYDDDFDSSDDEAVEQVMLERIKKMAKKKAKKVNMMGCSNNHPSANTSIDSPKKNKCDEDGQEADENNYNNNGDLSSSLSSSSSSKIDDTLPRAYTHSHSHPSRATTTTTTTATATSSIISTEKAKRSLRVLKELASHNGNGYDQVYSYDDVWQKGDVVNDLHHKNKNMNKNKNNNIKGPRRSKRHGKQTRNNLAILRILPKDKFMCYVDINNDDDDDKDDGDDDKEDHRNDCGWVREKQQQETTTTKVTTTMMMMEFQDIYNSGRNYLLHEHVDNKDGSIWTHHALLFQYGFQCHGCKETYFCPEMKSIDERPKFRRRTTASSNSVSSITPPNIRCSSKNDRKMNNMKNPHSNNNNHKVQSHINNNVNQNESSINQLGFQQCEFLDHVKMEMDVALSSAAAESTGSIGSAVPVPVPVPVPEVLPSEGGYESDDSEIYLII